MDESPLLASLQAGDLSEEEKLRYPLRAVVGGEEVVVSFGAAITYHGILSASSDDDLRWQCAHMHRSRIDALCCAEEYLRARVRSEAG